MSALQPLAVAPITGLEGTSTPVPPSTAASAVPVPRGYPHVALYDTLTAAGGLAQQRVTGRLVDWRERHAIEDGLVTHQWTGRLPSLVPGASGIAPGSVLRVVRRPGDVREYVVDQVSDGLGGDGLTTVTALGPEYLLATLALVTATEFSGIAAGAITALLAASDPVIPWLILGDAPSTAILDATPIPAGSSLGTALRAVATAVSNRENQAHELRLRRLDDTLMAVDILPVGADLKTVDLPYRVALTGLTRSRRGSQRVTRLVDPAAVFAGAYYRITALSPVSADVQGMAPGLGPAIEAGQWDGFGLLGPTSVLHPILTTTVLDAATTRFGLANTSDLAVGSLVQLRRGDGSVLAEVPLPSAAASSPIPIVRPLKLGIAAVTNFARNSAFADWAGDIPDQWTPQFGGAAKSTASGTWQTGGAAARIPKQAGLNQGGVMQTITLPPGPGGGGQGAFHLWARFFVISGDSQDIQVTGPRPTDPIGGGGQALTPPSVPPGSWGVAHWIFPGGAPGLSIFPVGVLWQTFFGDGVVNGVPQPVQPCHHYLDAVMFALTPAGVTLSEFEAGSGAARSIEGVNLAFARAARGDVTYSVQPLDLARTDPLGAGRFRSLSLGSLARIRGREAGVLIDDTVRVVEFVEPGPVPTDLSLTLASREPRLADVLARAT